MTEQMLERYDEKKGIVRLPLSKAIKNELETYRKLLKIHLASKPLKISTIIEHLRTWRINKDKIITVRFIIEENKSLSTSQKRRN